jgi:hypothetical protein
MIRQTEGYGDRINPDYVKNPGAAAAEETILGILLLHPELWSELQKADTTLTTDDFFTAFGKKVFAALEPHLSDPAFESGMLGAELTIEEMDRVATIRQNRSRLQQNSITVLQDSIARLREATSRSERSIEDILNQKRRKNTN